MTGKVIIAGAGTGSADLISIRAANALKNADTVVFDRLLGDGITKLIPENAERINVGKESGNHPVPQDEINKILLEKACGGKCVVRLKGGDPFMFGRGGEEAEFLLENKVPFEIIPGISSAIAAPELAGIPVTHRNFSSSVHILTGHFKDDKEIDYKALAKAGGTYVFLMGLKNAEKIQNGFLAAGLDKNTPCAVIENGGSAEQRVGISVLSGLSELAKDHASPSIIVIGEVCRLHEKLYTQKRLSGRNIVICRPSDRAHSLKAMLETEGARVHIVPSIKIIPLSFGAEEIAGDISAHKFIAFTSRTGVKLVFESLLSGGYDARIFGGKKIAVIGSGTAEELKKYGLRPDLMPQEFYTEELAGLLVKEKADNILLFRAENGSKGLDEILSENKTKFKTVYVYKTICEEEQILPPQFDTAVFASPSEAEFFKTDRKDFKAVCIGKRTLEAALKRGFDCTEAAEQTEKGLFDAIIKKEG